MSFADFLRLCFKSALISLTTQNYYIVFTRYKYITNFNKRNTFLLFFRTFVLNQYSTHVTYF